MAALRPFFSFYGGKWRSFRRYPAPERDVIIEPFAGSAGYSTRYPTKNVRLYDIDPVITGVWDYLIHVSEDEIRSLPGEVDTIEGLAVPEEARNLIGFWLNHGTTRPSKSASAWMRAGNHDTSFWGPAIRERIASQVQHIRHWTITNAGYHTIDDCDATWYVDPPYSTPAGRHYRFSDIDYDDLAEFCTSRSGQVIVCEQAGADWLPFESIGAFKSTLGSTKEVVWLN